MAEAFLFVGIGNVGNKYDFTRHNVGFWFIDELVSTLSAGNGFKSRFNSEYCKLTLGSSVVYAIKPSTFVNLTGESVREWKRFYKLRNEDVFVFYDDVSTPLGRIKIKDSGSSGGHNGIKSITQCIGAGYTQVKIGLQPDLRFLAGECLPRELADKGHTLVKPSSPSAVLNVNCASGMGSSIRKGDLSGFVLGKLSHREREVVSLQISSICKNIDLLIGRTDSGKSALIERATVKFAP